MKHLLVVAHGSRRAASNDEVRELVYQMRRHNQAYDRVDCAFLELAEPSIPDGIQNCIDSGAEEVIVLPYFLAAGTHVVNDIPDLIRGKQEEHPEMVIRQVGHVGALPGMIDLMLKAAD